MQNSKVCNDSYEGILYNIASDHINANAIRIQICSNYVRYIYIRKWRLSHQRV